MLGLPFPGDKANQNCRPGFLFILVVFICSLAIGVFSQRETRAPCLESSLCVAPEAGVPRGGSWLGRPLVLGTQQQ